MLTEAISSRLNAVKDALKAKGYKTPSVEIGCKVLGDYGFVCWGLIQLGSPKNWVDRTPDTDLDGVLAAIEAAVPGIPSFQEQFDEREAALRKLSPHERSLLGVFR